MKHRNSPIGQHLIEGLGSTENAYEHIQQLMPIIGEIVILSNALESDLDSWICESISDRSDQKGLLVLHNMNYSTKVALFHKFNVDLL